MQAHQSHVYWHSIDYCVLGIGRESIKTRSSLFFLNIYIVRIYLYLYVHILFVHTALALTLTLTLAVLCVVFIRSIYRDSWSFWVFICASFACWPNVKATGFLSVFARFPQSVR